MCPSASDPQRAPGQGFVALSCPWTRGSAPELHCASSAPHEGKACTANQGFEGQPSFQFVRSVRANYHFFLFSFSLHCTSGNYLNILHENGDYSVKTGSWSGMELISFHGWMGRSTIPIAKTDL